MTVSGALTLTALPVLATVGGAVTLVPVERKLAVLRTGAALTLAPV